MISMLLLMITIFRVIIDNEQVCGSGGGGVGLGGLAVTTMSKLNPSCIQLELGLSFDNSLRWM